MLSTILLFLLIIGCIVGLRRGFILQAIHLVGWIVAFIVAFIYYDDLASRLTLWIPYPAIGENTELQVLLDALNAETAFYNGIAFFIIFMAVKIVLQIIGSMLTFVTNIPVLKQLNLWLGGILGFLETYLIIFIILYMAALIPMEVVQNYIEGSWVAKGIINNTPVFSGQIYDLFFNK